MIHAAELARLKEKSARFGFMPTVDIIRSLIDALEKARIDLAEAQTAGDAMTKHLAENCAVFIAERDAANALLRAVMDIEVFHSSYCDDCVPIRARIAAHLAQSSAPPQRLGDEGEGR